MTPKFEIGDLVEFDELCLHLRPRPRSRLHLRLRLHLRPRLRLRDDKDEEIRNLGVVTDSHKAEDAYYDYEEGDPNCYDVFWHRIGDSCTVFEDEIKIPD